MMPSTINKYGRYSLRCFCASAIMLFFLFGLLSFALAKDLGREASKEKVLVLHSYHPGFTWTDGIHSGIVTTLRNSGKEIDLFTEYMDSKRFTDSRHFLNLYNLYKNKYKKTRFDVIISCDDNALNFLLKYHQQLFPGTPVAFCGVNDFDPKMLAGHPEFSGVVETINPKRTLDTALMLHPNTERVAFVVDSTPTGIGTARSTKEVLHFYPESIRFEFCDNMDMSEILEKVGSLPPKSLVVLMNYNRDRSGHVFSHLESIALLRTVCKVPIYGLWDFHVGRGIIGGVITSSRHQGEAGARIALRMLNGESASAIPVVHKLPENLIFDYRELKRFGIKLSQLPEYSTVINRPKTFYSVNKKLIWTLGVILAFLVLTTVVLTLNIMQRRRAQVALIKVNRALITLSNCSQAVVEAKNDSELLTEICRIIVEKGGYPLAWVAYPDPLRMDCLRPVAHWQTSGKQDLERAIACHDIQDPDGPTWQAIRTGRPCVVNLGPTRGEGRPWLLEAHQCGYASHIALPMILEGHVLGVLRICCSEADAFDEEEVSLLTKLADNLSYGIMTQNLATERLKAEEELRLSNEKLSMLLESLPIVPFTCRTSGDYPVSYVSRAIQEISGYPPERFVADPDFWLRHIHEDDRAKVLSELRRFDPNGKQRNKYRFRIADGSYRWFSDTRRIVDDSDKGVRRIVGTWQDITKEEMLRQEAESRLRQLIQADKLASLGELVAGVAHEINNPNSFISSNAPLMAETWNIFRPIVKEYARIHPDWHYNDMTLGELCEDMDEILQAIEIGSQRITQIVSELKTFARFDDFGKKEDIQINDVVRKALNIVGAQIRKYFARSNFILSPDLPPVQGYFTKLEQVVTNLLVNATHAVSSRPGGELTMTTRYLENRHCVMIQVEDNGQGIKPEIRERIFEPFFTTRRSDGGTGLGLSVSYRLVQENAGTITFVSRSGRGTRFTVFLPLNGDCVDIQPSLLWIGGDDAFMADLKETVASQSDRLCLLSVSGPDLAWKKLESHPEVQLVVVDLQKHRQDGWCVIKRVAEEQPLVTVGVYGYCKDCQTDIPQDLPEIDVWLEPPLKAALNHKIFFDGRHKVL